MTAKCDITTQCQFTADQLKIQRLFCEQQIENALKVIELVKRPEWQRAIDYGEEVRESNLKQLRDRVDYYTRRCAAIDASVPK